MCANNRFNFEHLPPTGGPVLGRVDDLANLNKVLQNDSINIVTLVAPGGVGKTALMMKWLEDLEGQGYPGFERGFGWSFYNQGTDGHAVSSDMFIDNILRNWLSRGDLANHIHSPWEKGRILAESLQEAPTLLILDGLEPLQSPYATDKGQLKDLALVSLLKQLTKKNNGLCVITTREPLKDFSDEIHDAGHVKQLDLDQISDQTGREILKSDHVRGEDQDLEALTRQYGNHALTLTLLGAYLTGQNVKNAKEIKKSSLNGKIEKPVWSVIKALTLQLQDPTSMRVLLFLGLFDRPITAEEINFLRFETDIGGLTDHLEDVNQSTWDLHLSNLRRLRLLLPESKSNENGFDAHPIVREYFRIVLQAKPKMWKQANSDLFDYFHSIPDVEQPDRFIDMEPLYRAIDFGCKAKRYQKAFEVLEKRLRRGDRHFSFFQGFLGAEKSALSGFFKDKLKTLHRGNLKTSSKAWLFNEAGSILRVTGRLEEAIEPIKKSIRLFKTIRDYKKAARSTATLVNVYKLSGNLKGALIWTRKAVNFVDRSKNTVEQVAKYSLLARILWFMGKNKEADQWIEKANELQVKHKKVQDLNFGLHETIWCDHLADQGKWKEIESKLESVTGWLTSENKRSYGLVMSALGAAKFNLGSLNDGNRMLSEGVDIIRQSGRQDELPRVLLARARCHLSNREFLAVFQDLDEAYKIADNNKMRLYMVDIYIEFARLHLHIGHNNFKLVKHYLQLAVRIAESTGYKRWILHLKHLSKQLDNSISNQSTTVDGLAEINRNDKTSVKSKKYDSTPDSDFDVFLAHNSCDKPMVETIADNLRSRGVKPWLDSEQIPPGYYYQDAILKAIRNAKSAAIFIGLSGTAEWLAYELRSLVNQSKIRKILVIPVLLPGVHDLPPECDSLRGRVWVEFEKDVNESKGLDNLVWAIKGVRPKGRTPDDEETGEAGY